MGARGPLPERYATRSNAELATSSRGVDCPARRGSRARGAAARLRGLGFGLDAGEPGVQPLLEELAQILAGDRRVPQRLRLQADDRHRRLPAQVAARVALR